MSGIGLQDSLVHLVVAVIVTPWVLRGDELGDVGPLKFSHADGAKEQADTRCIVARATRDVEALHIVAVVDNAEIWRRDRVDGIGLARAVEHATGHLTGESSEIDRQRAARASAERGGRCVLLRTCRRTRNIVPFRPAVHNHSVIVEIAKRDGELVVWPIVGIAGAVAIDEQDSILPGFKLRLQRAEGSEAFSRLPSRPERQAKSKTDHCAILLLKSSTHAWQSLANWSRLSAATFQRHE
ncbi:hypothetical protein D3C87_1357490 [compost metagenome]